MHFTPHTERERAEMLETIGVANVDDLFRDVPEHARFPWLGLPPPLSEMELTSALRQLACSNQDLDTGLSFLGAGAYRHFIPATVDYVLQRGEFYTAYTPYQPELSQGLLQAMFEYQSMICRLTGMEISNASHYDGATSLAEAVLLAINAAQGKRSRIVMSGSVHPHYRDVVSTYLRGTDADLIVPEASVSAADDLASHVGKDCAAVVVQNPDFFGYLEDYQALADTARTQGALFIVLADPISLGLFKPPGEYGADIVVADGQPLGIAPSFGGPSVGIFATRRTHLRQLAGRLVGETVDAQGRRGFVLVLATREQHIRRARATSNICTNSALGALAAATYLATMGKHGLRRVAELCFHKSHYAASRIGEVSGLAVNPDKPDAEFFKEFVVALPRPASEVNRTLREEHGIIGGLDLGRFFPGHDDWMLIAVTEMSTRAGIDRFAEALRSAVRQ